jgi:hypothetical protein
MPGEGECDPDHHHRREAELLDERAELCRQWHQVPHGHVQEDIERATQRDDQEEGEGAGDAHLSSGIPCMTACRLRWKKRQRLERQVFA